MAKTTDMTPNFGESGLIAAVAQDHITKQVLMLAWMNEEAYNKTLETGEAHYWSRSRQELWHKGGTSGSVQIVKEIILDCDQDAVVMLIDQKGTGACHTGVTSCFFNKIGLNKQI